MWKLFRKLMNKSERQPTILDANGSDNGAVLFLNGIKRWAVVVGPLLLFALFYNQCVVITHPDEYIVIQQFGEIKSILYEPGLSLKAPFIQSKRSLPKYINIYDIPISDVITQE